MEVVKTSYEPSINCANFVLSFEGEKLKAYKCPAGVWTIGVGITMYSTGLRVKEGDVITQAKSRDELGKALRRCGRNLSKFFNNYKVALNQNQVDALISFIFNVGESNFGESTLYKLIKVNPNDEAIRHQFSRWVYGGNGQHNGKDDDGDGQIDEPGEKQLLPGLVRRRKAEADLYFKK